MQWFGRKTFGILENWSLRRDGRLQGPGWSQQEVWLKYHRLEKHLMSTKNDRVKVVKRHWLLQMRNPEGTDLLQTRLTERDEAENEPLLHGDKDDSDEDDNGGSESSSD